MNGHAGHAFGERSGESPAPWSAERDGQGSRRASDPVLAALVQRFGLLAAYVPAPVDASDEALHEARTTVHRLGSLLERACARLGIAPATWGRVAPVLLAVALLETGEAGPTSTGTPGDPATTGVTATSMPGTTTRRAYGAYSVFHQRVTVAMGAPRAWTDRRDARLVTTLVHEWVHALDHWAVRRHSTSLPAGTFLSDLAQRPLGPLAIVVPDALLRSAQMMARIQAELRGTVPPAQDTAPWSRFRAWAQARQWHRAAQRRDAALGQDYYTRAREQLARAVQFHQREDLDQLMRLPVLVAMGWRALPELPARPLHGTMALIRTWMAAEGLGSVERLVPDSSTLPKGWEGSERPVPEGLQAGLTPATTPRRIGARR